jgi:translocation and assembly module TamB
MSKPLRVILAVFGLLITLYVSLIAILSSEWFHDFLLRQAKTRLESLTGARVEIGAMTVRPTVLLVTLQGLVLRGKESASEPALLSAKTVVVRINPVGLLHSRVLLRSLDGDRAEVHLRTYPDGSTNLPGPQRPSEDGRFVVDDLMDLALRRATLTHANLYWNNQRIPLDFSARDVALLMRFNPAATRLPFGHALKGVSSVLSSGDRYVVSISSSELAYGLPGWTVPPLAFAAQLDFSRNDLALRSLTWRSSGLRGQASLSLYRLPVLNAQLAVKAEGELASLAKILGFPEVKSGSFEWDAQSTYQGGRQEVLEAKGRLQARRLTVADPSFALGDINLSTDYLADRRHVELSNLRLSLLGGTVQGRAEGSLQGPSPKFIVHTELQQLSLGQLLESISSARDITPRLRVDSSVGGTADVTWSGKLKNLNSSFDLSFEPRGDQARSRFVVGFARGTAKAAPGLLVNLEDAELQTPHGLIRAGGTLGGGAINLSVLLTTSDFEEWRPLVELWSRPEQPVPLVLKSPATFSGTVLGSLDQPQVRGRIAIGAFDFRGWGWDHLEANVFVSPELLQVSSGRLVHKDSALTFNIGLGLDHGLFTPSSVVHIIAEAQRTPLAGLRDALELHYPIEGSATGHLDLSGTRASLTGAGAIHVEQGQIDGESFDSLAARFRVEESVWEIQDVRLVKGGAQVKGQARLDPARQAFSADLHASDLSLADIRPLLFHGVTAPATPGTLQGRLQFDLHGEGTVENPQLQSTFEVRDITSGGSPIGHLRGQLSWQGTRLQVKGDFGGADGVLNFDGSAQTEKDWPIQVSGRYVDFHVDPWVNWAEPDALKVAVTSSGSLRLSGPLKDPGRLELQSEAESLEISLPVSGPNGMVWKNQQPVSLTYSAGMLAVSRFVLHGPSTELEVEGSVRFTGQPVLALNMQGHADASIIRLIDPTLLSAGSFELDLKAAGSPSRPVLSGAVTVKDLSIGYPDIPVRASGLNGEIRLEGDRAVISLRERSGQSPLSLSGYVTLLGPTRFDLRLDLDHERLEFPADVTSVLGGHLRFVGTPENPQLLGQLVVEQTAVRPDFDLLAWMDRLQGPSAVPAAGAKAPFASKIQVNVAVVSHPQVRIDSRNLRLVAVIDLRLQGTAADPVALGTIRLLSGDTVIRSNRYQVTRGDITLSNPVRTTPVLDLEAHTRIQRYDLTLNVNGPLDRAKISYRSDPPLRSEDVLSLLALGYAPSEQQMTAGGSGSPNMSAASLLSAAISSGATGRVQRLFGVTRLRVDPSQYQTTTSAGYQVTVEQQPAPNFTITYILNTGVAGHNVVQLEWNVRENVSLFGERDINGVYGAEVRFQRRFK